MCVFVFRIVADLVLNYRWKCICYVFLDLTFHASHHNNCRSEHNERPQLADSRIHARTYTQTDRQRTESETYKTSGLLCFYCRLSSELFVCLSAAMKNLVEINKFPYFSHFESILIKSLSKFSHFLLPNQNVWLVFI